MRYAPEFKAKALNLMQAKGPYATARELGISVQSLYIWKENSITGGDATCTPGDTCTTDNTCSPRTTRTPGSTYTHTTPEFKATVLESYKTIGGKATLRKYHISGHTLYKWIEESGIEKNGTRVVDHNRSVDRSEAVRLYYEAGGRGSGTRAVMEKYGVCRKTVGVWVRAAKEE